MPNIVYALTNQAMPGLVKIGMTDRADMQRRMNELYSTGVPLPFDCVMARQLDDREAAEIEKALHTAFDAYRINSSREFFEIDPEQVKALLRVMPGEDVMPLGAQQTQYAQAEDREAAEEFVKRRTRNNEQDFLDSLDENGRRVHERVLAWGKQDDIRINLARRGYSLRFLVTGDEVAFCYGYPAGGDKQRIYTSFPSMQSKAGLPDDRVHALRQSALDTGLFEPSGRANDLRFETSRWLNDEQLDALLGWLHEAVAAIKSTQPDVGGMSASAIVFKRPTGSDESGEGPWMEAKTSKQERP